MNQPSNKKKAYENNKKKRKLHVLTSLSPKVWRGIVRRGPTFRVSHLRRVISIFLLKAVLQFER